MAKTTTFTRARVISALKPIYSQVISGEKFIEKFGAEDKAVREKRETLE